MVEQDGRVSQGMASRHHGTHKCSAAEPVVQLECQRTCPRKQLRISSNILLRIHPQHSGATSPPPAACLACLESTCCLC